MAGSTSTADRKKVLDGLVQQMSSTLMQPTMKLGVANPTEMDWNLVLALIGRGGTNIIINAHDPLGDGYQRPFGPSPGNKGSQLHRELWANGADTEFQMAKGNSSGFNAFQMSCLTGNVAGVKLGIANMRAGEASNRLELRHGLLRQSIIFLPFVGLGRLKLIKKDTSTPELTESEIRDKYLQVLRLLLAAGSRIDAKDLCGKTVLHYAVGPLSRTYPNAYRAMAKLAIRKAFELPTPVKLIDVVDRWGNPPIAVVIMNNDIEMANFCCEHEADVLIKDVDNLCPANLAQVPGSSMHTIINARMREQEYRAFKSHCGNCGEKANADAFFQMCSQCKKAWYCSPSCQKAHWPEHKRACLASNSNTDQGGAPAAPGSVGFTILPCKSGVSMSLIGEATTSWTGALLPGIPASQLFDIKVQINTSPEVPMMVYNESKSLFLYVDKKNCPKSYLELHQLVASFAPCEGRKAYFKACIHKEGELFVAVEPRFVCKW